MSRCKALIATALFALGFVSGCAGGDAPSESPPESEQALVGKICALNSGSPLPACAASEYCNVGPTCGNVGACAQRQAFCLDGIDPVCGCDGRVYANACEAARRGVSVKHAWRC